jgi:hypothetical protein
MLKKETLDPSHNNFVVGCLEHVSSSLFLPCFFAYRHAVLQSRW